MRKEEVLGNLQEERLELRMTEEVPSRTDTPQPAVATVANLKIGCKVFAEKDGEYRKAELLSFQVRKSGPHYYVHYQDFNKRLDEWISATRLDLNRPVEWPKAEKIKAAKYAAAKAASLSIGTPVESSQASTPKVQPQTQQPNRRAPRSRAGTPSNEGVVVLPTETKATAVGADEAIISTEVIGSKPESVANEVAEDEEDAEPNGIAPVFSKEAEIEKLRTSGSMTQSHHEISRVKNFSKVVIGKYEVEPWYFSPYPIELTECDCLYICEFCLLYFGTEKQYARHRSKCTLLHPPGNEIYRLENVSFFEIDGRRQRTWCRNLCLISKLFLDHKTLYYDVDPFLFYCMTARDEYGCHLIGYFSKEKESSENYNVACILTLPQYQRLGYGRLLINFSYELSKREGKAGSPEKPLSDLGLLSYRAYWAETLTRLVVESNSDVSIDELARAGAMTTTDVLHTLQNLNMLKYYKGQHIICLTDGVLEQFEKQKKKRKRIIDSHYLHWNPPNFSREQLRYLN